MKKIIMAVIGLVMCLTFFITSSKVYAFDPLKPWTEPEVRQTVLNIFNDFDDSEFRNIAGSTYKGEIYRSGILDKRRCIEYGSVNLVVRNIEDITRKYVVGDVSSISETVGTCKKIKNEFSFNTGVKLKFLDEISASVQIKIVNIGAKKSLEREYSFNFGYTYTYELEEQNVINVEYDVNNIPSDKKSFTISNVGLFFEIEIKKMYTERRVGFFGIYRWEKDSVEKLEENAMVRYCVDSVITKVYNDNTFGNTVSGVYKLNKILRSF